MPEDPDPLTPDPSQTEEEGGPVKSFLEHLEDLRWVLIKSGVSLGIAFLVCLLGAHQVVKVLMHPLQSAQIEYPAKNQIVTFFFGTNRLGVFELPPGQRELFNLGTNQFVAFHVKPVTIGTNIILAVTQDANSTEAKHLTIPLASFSPAGAFMIAVQVALYAGILIASPLILYFIAGYVFPALKMRERKYIFRGLFYALGLFLLGVSFCYFLLMPIALSASVVYTNWLGFSITQWRAEDYISFVSKFILGMGLGFETPVVLLVLVKIGLLNYKILSKARRYVIVISFFLGSVLTTPEVVTQVLMAIPLLVLYEITVWIAYYWEWRDRKKESQAIDI